MKDDSNVGRPEKYSSEDLCRRAMEIQKQHPLFSEGAICGLLEVHREYIADRAKKHPLVKETRAVMDAIRQGAWEQKGIEMMDAPSSLKSPVIYIWMTRNMLGWRNDSPQGALPSTPASEPGAEQSPLMTSGDYLNVLRARTKPGGSI